MCVSLLWGVRTDVSPYCGSPLVCLFYTGQIGCHQAIRRTFETGFNVYGEVRHANLDQSLHGAGFVDFDALDGRPPVRYLVRHQPEDAEHA